MLTSIIFAMGLKSALVEDKPLVCAVMGSAVKAGSPALEHAGTKFTFCCGGCDETFQEDPQKAIKKQVKAGKTIGEFLFDPVSTNRILAKNSKGNADFEGVRYYFESEANKEKFEKDSKKFATAPKKESLVCAVMGSKIESYSKASNYVDHDGVRYFMCCGGCKPAMDKNPAKYAGKEISEPKFFAVKN